MSPPSGPALDRSAPNGGPYWPFIVGGGLAVLAPFLTWVHVVILGNLNQFQLLNADHVHAVWAVVPILLGILAAALGAGGGRDEATLAIPAGLGIIAADGIMLLALEHNLHHAYGLASTGLGPWLGIAGGCVIAVSAIANAGAQRPDASEPAG